MDIYNGLLYIKEEGILGSFAGIDLTTGTVKIYVDDNIYEADIEAVEKLDHVMKLHDGDGELDVYVGDVFVGADKKYIVKLVDGYRFIKYLDDNLNEIPIIGVGIGLPINELEEDFKEGKVQLLGNIVELKRTPDFNVKIARKFKDGDTTYYYVCNNKEENLIDLIKVVFVGADILDGDYTRKTITYFEYLDLIESGELKEVDPMELANYALGVMHGNAKISDVSLDELSGDIRLAKTKCYTFCEDECDQCNTYQEDEDEELF
ncbi:hypothetical protein IEN91_04740 [Bacillus velezensis]|nr:hypothetical protein IEN91_04740 [Bacillus velezensis]